MNTKLIKKIKAATLLIEEKKSELARIDDSIYYNTVGKNRKEIDKEEIKTEIKDLVGVKYSYIESLIQSLELEKMDLSSYQRQLNTTV